MVRAQDDHTVSSQTPLTMWSAKYLREIATADYDVQTHNKVAQCLLDQLGACISALYHKAAPPIGHYLDKRIRGARTEASYWGAR